MSPAPPVYRPWRDPVFCASITLYALNKWVLTLQGFFREHFNDVLLIPVALPIILVVYGWLKLRQSALPPSPLEVVMHLALWSVLCEWLGPLWLQRGTADPLDVLAYSAGALAAGLYWWRLREMPKVR